MRRDLKLILVGILLCFALSWVLHDQLTYVVKATTETTLTDINEDMWIRWDDPTYTEYDLNQLIINGGGGIDDRSYIEWNLTGQGIPSNAIIDKVEFRYKVFNSAFSDHARAYSMEIQPSTRSNSSVNLEALFADAGNGTAYLDGFSGVSLHTWFIDELNSSCYSDIDISKGWFAIGFASTGPNGAIWASNNIYDPLLIITWHLATDYQYNFDGVFWGNGTAYPVNITVTAIAPDGNEGFWVNATEGATYYHGYAVTRFGWSFGGDGRVIYPAWNNETYSIVIPEDTYAVYEIDVNDYTGRIGRGDTYVESYRILGGVDTMIERVYMTDVINDVPLVLTVGRVYTLKVRFYDNTTATFALWVTGSDLTKSIYITKISFSDSVKINYRYVTIDATRLSAEQITVNYNDTLGNTNNVTWIIKYQNGSVALRGWNHTDAFQENWLGADGYNSYFIYYTIIHGDLGTVYYSQPIGAFQSSFNPMINFGELGSGGSVLLPIILILGVGGAFSFASAVLGGASMAVLSAVFVYYGWLSIPQSILYLVFFMVIIWLLVGGRRR